MTKVNKIIFLIINFIVFMSVLSFCSTSVYAEGKNILSYPGASNLPVDGDGNKTIFTEVSIKKVQSGGGTEEITANKPIEIKAGEKVFVSYKFEIPNQLRQEIQRDDFYDFKLPEIDYLYLENSFESIIKDDRGIDIGTYITEPSGDVKMIFIGGTTGDNIKGNIDYELSVDANKKVTIGKKDIKFPYVKEENDTVVIYVDSPGKRKDIVKTHVRTDIDDRTGIVTETWDVLVNKYNYDYGLSDMVLKDIVTSGQYDDLKPSIATDYDIEWIQPVKVFSSSEDGSYREIIENDGQDFSGNFELSPDGKTRQYRFGEKGSVNHLNRPYKFRIKTKLQQVLPNTSRNNDVRIWNRATLSGSGKDILDEAQSAHKVNYDKWLRKEGEIVEEKTENGGKDIVEWSIYLNENNYDLGNVLLEDRLSDYWYSEQELELIQDSIKIDPPLKYTINPSITGDNYEGFAIQFEESVTSKVTITFQTEVKKRGSRVYNVAWLNDLNAEASVVFKDEGGSGGSSGSSGEGSTSSENPTRPKTSLNKTGKGVASKDKAIEWTLTFNPELLPLNSWKIEDRLYLNDPINSKAQLGNINKDSLRVVTWNPSTGKYDEEVPENLYDVTWVSKNDKEERFEIDYPNPTNKAFQVIYTSAVETSALNEYHNNTGTYHYNPVDGESGTINKNAIVKLNKLEIDMKKIGTYEGEFNREGLPGDDDTILWEIYIDARNEFRTKIYPNSLLEDPILEGQEYVEGSAKRSYTFGSAGKKEPLANGTFEYDPVNNKMIGTLPEGEKKEFVYSFRTRMIEKGPDGKPVIPGDEVTNTAYYSDDVNYAEAEAKVNIRNSSFGSKSGTYNPDTDRVDWTAYINPKRKHLENVVIEDSHWENHRVIKDTIKLVELDDDDKEVRELEEGIDYDLLFSEQKFRISMKDSIREKYKLIYSSNILIPQGTTVGTTVRLFNSLEIRASNVKTVIAPIQSFVDVKTTSTGGTVSSDYVKVEIIKYSVPEEWDGSVNTVSSDPNATLLPGAEFELYKTDTEKETFINFGVTDAQGRLEFEQLRRGKYKLVESKVPEGHNALNRITEFELVESDLNTIKTIPVINQQGEGLTEIRGKKIWEDDGYTSLRPETITVQLLQNNQPYKDDKGQEVTQVMSAATKWEYEFTELPTKDNEGKDYQYRVVEKEVPGYVASHEDGSNNIINTLQLITIEGEKWWHDEGYESNRPTEIKVQLLQDTIPMDNKIATASEATNWKYKFEGLPKINPKTGLDFHYTVEELDVPDGYTVSYDGTIIINSIEKGSVKLIKQDHITKETLKGAVFKLEKKNENTDEWELVTVDGKTSFTTNDQGEINIENLGFGEYRLIETQAPDGYIIDETPIDFILEGTKQLELTFDNDSETPLPETGGTGTFGILLMGTLLLLITSGAYYIHQKVGGD